MNNIANLNRIDFIFGILNLKGGATQQFYVGIRGPIYVGIRGPKLSLGVFLYSSFTGYRASALSHLYNKEEVRHASRMIGYDTVDITELVTQPDMVHMLYPQIDKQELESLLSSIDKGEFLHATER